MSFRRMTVDQAAAVLDAEAEREWAAARRAVSLLSRRVRVATVRAAMDGDPDPSRRAAMVLASSRPMLASVMATAYARGRERTRTLAAASRRELSLSSDMGAVIDFLGRRAAVSGREMLALQRKYDGAALSATGKLTGRLERAVLEAVRDVAGKGLSTPSGVRMLRKRLDAEGFGVFSKHALETTYRTQLQIAFNAGRWDANKEPSVAGELWGYEYVTVGDDRVRPNHEAMDGARYPKDDPIWRTIWPPNGYNCRCSTVEIFRGDRLARKKPLARQVKIDGATVTPGPDDGFAVNFAEVFR